jgi:spermidine/putrescine transport system substrate-binding protein
MAAKAIALWGGHGSEGQRSRPIRTKRPGEMTLIPTEPESPSQRFTRRQLIYQGAVLAAALGVAPGILAACGGETGTTAAASGSASAAGGSVAGTVSFLSWQGYDLVGVPAMDKWCKDNDVVVKSTYISTHADITSKFTTGGGKGIYNTSSYFQGYGPWYESLGIPTPLDMSKVPNFKDTYPIFQTGPIAEHWYNINGNQLCVPFTWGLMGCNYDSAKTSAPASYLDLLDPKYKGKVGIVDDLIGSIVIGAHVKGLFKTDSLYTPDEAKQIMSYWTELKKNARTIIPSYGNMADQFVAGEIIVGVPGWAAVNNFAAGKGDKTVAHTVPQEGAAAFTDGYMIPPDAPEMDTVYAWINQALTPEVQAQTAEFLVQGAVTPAAVPLMSAETAALYPYDQIDDILTNQAPLEAIPVDAPSGYVSWDEWNKIWTAFKAS